MAQIVDIPSPPRRPAPPSAERRVMPHNSDIEASLLGGIVLQPDVLAQLDSLEIDDFYELKHKVVFEAIRNLRAAGRPIDVVMLEAEIERRGKLDAVGGIAFLCELVARVPTVDNVLAYRDDIQLLARNRRAIIELSSALERAWTWQHDPSDLISEVSGQLARFDDLSKPAPKRLRLINIEQALGDLDQLAKAPVYPSPFETLNDAIGFGGFLGTQVYTVAAGTGRGKTTWVAHVAAFAAQSVPVVVASYEMKPGYFIARKAAGVLGRHSNDIIRGRVPTEQVLAAMPYPNMFLMHRPSLAELREAVLYVSQKFNCAPLLVVDYIQKLADEIALTMQRPDLRIATSQASATLCDIAEKTGAAVIAVSAIGRGKGRILANPRKLQPYELVEVAKESGAVEYDGAGLIVLSLSDDFDGEERIGTMTCAKVRFGEECHIDARYHGPRGTWRDIARVDVSPKLSPKPDDGAVAEAILAALKKHGAQASKTKVWKASGKNKEAVFSELDVMRQRGLIVWSPTLGFALPEQADAAERPPAQGTISGVDP